MALYKLFPLRVAEQRADILTEYLSVAQLNRVFLCAFGSGKAGNIGRNAAVLRWRGQCPAPASILPRWHPALGKSAKMLDQAMSQGLVSRRGMEKYKIFSTHARQGWLSHRGQRAPACRHGALHGSGGGFLFRHGRRTSLYLWLFLLYLCLKIAKKVLTPMKKFIAGENENGVRLSRFVESVTRDMPRSLLYKVSATSALR